MKDIKRTMESYQVKYVQKEEHTDTARDLADSSKENIWTPAPPAKLYKKNPDNQVSMYIIEPKWHFKIKITYKYTTVYKSCTVNKL